MTAWGNLGKNFKRVYGHSATLPQLFPVSSIKYYSKVKLVSHIISPININSHPETFHNTL